MRKVSSGFGKGVTERGLFALARQYIVSLRGRTGNHAVTQMRHPLLVEGRPNCARQSLASTLSAPRVAATSYCDPGRPDPFLGVLISLGLFKPKKFLGVLRVFSCFSLFFSVFLCNFTVVERGQKSLVFWEVF